jgi:HPr kinase/phosphorylase
MTQVDRPSIHASSVLIGASAVLVRGPAGSGKSQLVLALLEAATTGQLLFARLVSDDRTIIEAVHGRVLARPVPELAGLIEVRGLGIRRLPYEPVAVVSRVIDLAASDAARLPDKDAEVTVISGIELPRIAPAPGRDPLPCVLAALTTDNGLEEN